MTGAERLMQIAEVSDDASVRIHHRIGLDKGGVIVRALPIDGKIGLKEILDFMDLAKDGYEMDRVGFKKGAESLEVYRHTLTVLVNLSERMHVATNEGISFWPRPLNTENIGKLLNEISEVTLTMLTKSNPVIAYPSAARAFHFFDRSKLIASSFGNLLPEDDWDELKGGTF